MLRSFNERRRAALLTLAAAAWGVAAGVTIATLWIAGPHPGQLPGAMLAHGLDGRVPLRGALTMIIAPVLAVLAVRPLVRRAAADGAAQTWALRATGIALLSGLWLALVDPFDSVSILFIPLVGAAAFFLLRRVEASFATDDILLIPSAIALFISLAALWPALPLTLAAVFAAAITMSLRLAVGHAQAFALAPLAMVLQARVWFPDSLAIRSLALLWVLASPIALRRFRGRRRLVAYAVYPLFAIALVASTDLAGVEGMPRLNLFEDGHSLMPAAEMLRGERPYRDIVPGHGLIADGLLDFISMKLGAGDAGAVLRVRGAVSALFPAAIYFVALAATGSAEAAILAVLAAFCVTITGTPWAVPVSAIEAVPPLRAIPSLLALAMCAAAMRLRSRRWLAGAGILAVVAVLTSLDFGLYALIALIVATLRFSATSRGRRDAAVAGAGGLVIAAVPAALIMLIAGCLTAFLRVTLFEIPPLGEVYSVAFFQFPDAYARLRGLPEIAAGLFAERTIWIAAWGAIAVATSAALAVRTRHRLIEPIVVCGVWVMAAAISYAERTNVYFMPVAVVFAVALVHATRRRSTAFAAATLALVIAAAPTSRLMRTAALRRQHGPQTPLTRYDALPRARGVWVDPDNARKLAAAQTFVDRALRPSDTFFDFANMPGLYYLFERHCPVRQYETPFYETDALQREVIAALERDSSVRAALMQFPNRGDYWIDNVPNAVRAPLVFAWLRAHFVPAYERDGVVFWVRRQ
jgi:hypothetical protein